MTGVASVVISSVEHLDRTLGEMWSRKGRKEGLASVIRSSESVGGNGQGI